MTIKMAGLLRNAGFRPAVLSRGYAGTDEGILTVVSDGNNIKKSPAESGDEPFLIAVSSPGAAVLTGPDRFTAGMHAIEDLGANVIILDDAFQHRKLHRDINVLLLDAQRPFGNNHLLPRGPLREQEAGVKRADMIVFTRADEKGNKTRQEKELERSLPRIPFFRATHKPKGIIPLSLINPGTAASLSEKTPDRPAAKDPNVVLGLSKDDISALRPFDRLRAGEAQGDRSDILPPEAIRGRKVCAFAGIARPDSFRRTLESLGAEVVAFRHFPDHCEFTAGDLEEIRRKSEDSGAEMILTTEKDGARLIGRNLPDMNLCMLRIEMDIFPERKKFEDAVLARLKP
jgi:tetraacyldisaccharide 4'-kinase